MCECVCDRMCARALVHPLCVWERGVGRETQTERQTDRQIDRMWTEHWHTPDSVCVFMCFWRPCFWEAVAGSCLIEAGSASFLLWCCTRLSNYSQPQGDSPVFASYLTRRVRVEDVCHCIWILMNGAHQVCLTNVTLCCLPIIHPFIQFKQLSWARIHILYNFSEIHSLMLVYPQI